MILLKDLSQNEKISEESIIESKYPINHYFICLTWFFLYSEILGR